jgi:hypothetical protein
MKLFLVTGSIRDGEAEYEDHFIVRALNMDKACQLAEKVVEHELGFGDYRIVEVERVQEITLQEGKTLERLGLAYVAI